MVNQTGPMMSNSEEEEKRQERGAGMVEMADAPFRGHTSMFCLLCKVIRLGKSKRGFLDVIAV